jgi:hypothetical protein
MQYASYHFVSPHFTPQNVVLRGLFRIIRTVEWMPFGALHVGA